ncbi:protein of unknown function [Moritella yayanosii]|uniref:Uncharacterized protein n=1 Tax=Moritella yayanosii TaxID=69539 RepID=A0A330LNA6_9GAMM|nr:protein of unknown function [Moritella yayanosii]
MSHFFMTLILIILFPYILVLYV